MATPKILSNAFLALALLALGAGFGMIASCSSDVITNPDSIIFPAANVSFRQHVQPVLSLDCNITGCHDAPRSNNNFVALTSWSAVRNIRVVNQPGDTNSGLVRIVFGRQIHASFIPVLPENQKQGIKQWVLEGAKDN